MGMENAILKWKTERTMIENTRYTLTALIGFGMKRNPHSLGNHTVTLFSVYLYYYQMNHSVFWTITSTWPDLSIRGKKCPIGDDQLSQLSALSISIV